MSDSVVIVSGGMDSVTLLHYLVVRQGKSPTVISFLYGQKHAREVEFAKWQAASLQCADHRIVDLSMLRFLFATSALVNEDIGIPGIDEARDDPQPLTYVPNRNMIFLALAAALAESLQVSTVYYGAQAHDMYGYWDTTPEFLKNLNAVFSLNRSSAVRIEAPFVKHSKVDILRTGLELDVDYSRTWSCYAGQELACGTCPTCAERLEAFAQLGMTDPLPYA